MKALQRITESSDSSEEVHIASLAIFPHPSHRREIIELLSSVPMCSLYTDDDCAGIVAVLEVCDESVIRDITDDLHSRRGVLSVNLVYHHVDSRQSLNQEITP